MKKIISLILVVVMTIALFAGCGEKGNSKVTPAPKLDLSGLEQAERDAIGNAPKNFKYEDIVNDENGEMYIRRIQYRDGDKLKYWDYCTGKYIKDEKGAGGHFDYVYDYSKKTEADIKDDEWIYAENTDHNFYVIYFGWASTWSDVDRFYDEIKKGKVKYVKAENGVYGCYSYAESKISEKPIYYTETYIENGIETKYVSFYLDENGIKTDKIISYATQSMFGEVSFEIPKNK